VTDELTEHTSVINSPTGLFHIKTDGDCYVYTLSVSTATLLQGTAVWTNLPYFVMLHLHRLHPQLLCPLNFCAH
jgi:hypothetical protein